MASSNDDVAGAFWRELAERTAGKHISMEQFSTVVDLMLAICYRETGPEFLQVRVLSLSRSFLPNYQRLCFLKNAAKRNTFISHDDKLALNTKFFRLRRRMRKKSDSERPESEA